MVMLKKIIIQYTRKKSNILHTEINSTHRKDNNAEMMDINWTILVENT
jgi:hypothetical protein